MNTPRLKMDITASLQTLPSPPFVAMEIIRLTRDQDSDAGDLAAVLSNDPVLATRILQVANSPAYGLSREVTSIDRAVALLGLKAVKMMALSFSLASELGDNGGSLDMDTYWYHSLLNAVTARRWAEATAHGLAEEAFLTGLLSHLGRLVLSESKPAEYAEVLKAGGVWPSFEAETAVFGFSSADVTMAVLEEWGLPELIVTAAATMYVDAEASEEVNGAEPLAAVLKNVVLTEHALGECGDPAAVEALHDALSMAGLNDIELEEFVHDLEYRVRDMADTLSVDLPEGMSHQVMLGEARSRLVEVSLDMAHNLQTVEQAAEDLRASNQQLEGMAFEDRLTGVPNRAAFDDHLARCIAGAVRRDAGSVGMILFDIDHFKRFNDTYGHQIGDDVLKAVAHAASRVTRADELFARYGGEEFALVVVDCSMNDLAVTGERIRATVEATEVPSTHGPLKVTISGGAALLTQVHDRDAGERLIKLADDALYGAKDAGRNQLGFAQ